MRCLPLLSKDGGDQWSKESQETVSKQDIHSSILSSPATTKAGIIWQFNDRREALIQVSHLWYAARCEWRRLKGTGAQMQAAELQSPNYSRTRLGRTQEGAPYCQFREEVGMQQAEILQWRLARRWTLVTAISQRILGTQPAPGGPGCTQISNLGAHPKMLPTERGERRRRSGETGKNVKRVRQRIEGASQQEEAPIRRRCTHGLVLTWYWDVQHREAGKGNGFEIKDI